MKTFFALTTGLLTGFIVGACAYAVSMKKTEDNTEKEDDDSDKVIVLD